MAARCWVRWPSSIASPTRSAGGGGFWARRFAAQARRAERAALVRGAADADPARGPGSRAAARARDRPLRRAAAAKLVRASPTYKKGAYHKVVDYLYDDAVAGGPARTSPTAPTCTSRSIDHVRSSSKTKRSASGKTKRKTKSKKKSELTVTLSVPTRNYAPVGGRRARRPEGVGQAGREPHDGQAQRHDGQPARRRGPADPDAARADLGRLRARRAGAQEEAVSASAASTCARASAGSSRCATARTRRRPAARVARGGSARSTWRRTDLCVECVAKRDEDRDVDPTARPRRPRARPSATARSWYQLERLLARCTGARMTRTDSDTDYRWYDEPGERLTTMTTAAGSTTPEPLRALWLTETYPPSAAGWRSPATGSCAGCAGGACSSTSCTSCRGRAGGRGRSRRQAGGRYLACPIEDDPAHALNRAWSTLQAAAGDRSRTSSPSAARGRSWPARSSPPGSASR